MKNLILPLLPKKARPAAKAWLAAIMAVLTVLSTIYDIEPLTVALAVLTALGVYAQPNGDKPSDDADEPEAPAEPELFTSVDTLDM